MPRQKSTTKESTKKKTTQKKKAGELPKKATASKADQKSKAASAARMTKAAKTAKSSRMTKGARSAATGTRATSARTSKSAKTAGAAKMPRTAKRAKSTYAEEKRKHLRLHYSRLISFIHYDAKNNIVAPGSMAAVKDLSQAGILIETGAMLKPGDKLEMDIAFEQDKIIPAQGEVIHVRNADAVVCNAGVKFTKIKRRDLTYLKGFVDGRLAKA